MNYPVWDVPVIGSGWVIGMIAIFHVMISHFAVGGGLYLAVAEQKAIRENRRDWLHMLHNHARFFLVLTGVLGAVSGVGIWFAIGLAHPEATSTLIHNFVFGWAIEWVFFIVELATAAVYYYTWDRIPDALHVKVGWLYAIASLCTLVIINGILTFMLTPGETWLTVAGTGQEASRFWNAFFNPTYWPSLVMRILVCCSLAGIWSLYIYSQLDGEALSHLKADLIRWSAGWLLPSFLLMPLVLGWYLWNVPEAQRQLLSLGMSTIGSGAFTQVTRIVLVTVMTSATIVGVVYFFAWNSPEDFSRGHALSVLFLALAATGATEQAREMLRKPYVIGRHMYSNGVRVSEVAEYNRTGYLTAHPLWVANRSVVNGEVKLVSLTDEQLAKGEAMFRGQCLSCHTREGYRSMKKFLAARDFKSIGSVLKMLHEGGETSPYKAYMPPLVGTDEEIAALQVYLSALNGSAAVPAQVAVVPVSK
jgi:cytochrome bd-type quinol oxidase subunit 1